MRLDANKFSSAVRLALSLGAIATASSVTAMAQSTAGSAKKIQSLETIVVTGSNIRRVDIETANPVITIDRATDPAIRQDNARRPRPAAAFHGRRGDDAAGQQRRRRHCRRIAARPRLQPHAAADQRPSHPDQLQDLNMIPLDAVERVEVLNDGASAIYGSDAIAGVVNIITRSNYQGAEFGADYGISDHDDGERKAVHAIFGQSTEHGSILFGVQYDKQDAVSAANRKFSQDAQYNLPNGVNPHAGSSRTPTGSVFLPST